MMKCRYFKICKIANDNSQTCLHGGGSYCGHFRALYQVENRGKNKKIEIKKLNKLLKLMKKSELIAKEMSLGTTLEISKNIVCDILAYEIGNHILIVEKRIKECYESFKNK